MKRERERKEIESDKVTNERKIEKRKGDMQKKVGEKGLGGREEEEINSG